MSNQQIKLFPLHDRIEFTATAKLICKSQNVTSHNFKPQKRYGHLCFIYKSKLYVIGGYTVDNKNQPLTSPELKSVIHCYNLDKERSLSLEDKKFKKSQQNSDVKWQLIEAKFSQQAEGEFSLFSHAAHCIFPHKKRLYIFGGSSPEGNPSGSLFRLDLDSLEWSKPEQKGTVPKPREEATLSLYTKNDKNYLVLYGGANYETSELFSDINFYQIETKYWFQCHNLSQNFIQPRISPGICFNDNKIYIFGGYYLDAQYEKGYFNDLYEIQFNLTLDKGRPYGKSFAKRLDQIVPCHEYDTKFRPQKRCGSSLLLYKNEIPLSSQLRKQYKMGSQWLLLIGGQKACDEKKKQMTTLNDVWIFSLNDLKWLSIALVNEFKPRCNFSSCFDKESGQVFIFGGLSSTEIIFNDLTSIKLNLKIHGVEEEDRVSLKQNLRREDEPFTGQPIEDYLINEICNSINLPFSAMNLILDNFVNFHAVFCDIIYHISKSKNLSHNYIKFESNAQFGMPNDVLLSHFTCLKGGIRTYVQGTDKKIKAEMAKDNIVKEIGTNFIIGGLRLGNQLVFVNLNQETYEIQIIIVLKCNPIIENESQCQEEANQTFRLFNFTILREEILNEDVLGSLKNNEESKKRKNFFEKLCPEQSRERIRTLIVQGINSIKKGEVKNVFFISKLRTISGEECTSSTHESQLELYPDMLNNDIVYGDRSVIREIEMTTKIPIDECMDVSFRTFMSYMYITQGVTTMTLSIQGLERKGIVMQNNLFKIDELLEKKRITEVSSIFDLDCKIVELYSFVDNTENQEKNVKNGFSIVFNYLGKGVDTNMNNKFFAHGTLYYHKGRLIKRQPIELGAFLLHYEMAKIQQNYSFQKSIILRSSSSYSAAQIFGHIELPEAVPFNFTKTDFVFPAMLQKVDQKLKLMEDAVIREKIKKSRRLLEAQKTVN